MEATIPLGLQNHRSFRRSVRQWPRTGETADASLISRLNEDTLAQ